MPFRIPASSPTPSTPKPKNTQGAVVAIGDITHVQLFRGHILRSMILRITLRIGRAQQQLILTKHHNNNNIQMLQVKRLSNERSARQRVRDSITISLMKDSTYMRAMLF
jgi:hypothetical protein